MSPPRRSPLDPGAVEHHELDSLAELELGDPRAHPRLAVGGKVIKC